MATRFDPPGLDPVLRVGQFGGVSPGPCLAAENLWVRLPGRRAPVLDRAGLGVSPGEVVGIRGRSGAGKSTLLGALCGLVPWLRPAEVLGRVTVNGDPVDDMDPGQRAHILATVLDRPESQLFLPTPGDELAAARRLYGDSPLMGPVLEALEITPLLRRQSVTLSSGERQRVALALGLAASPRPVLLDEPTAHLDAGGCTALAQLLPELSRSGGAVLLAEQAGWRLRGAVRRWLALSGGRLAAAPPPEPPDLPPAPGSPGEPVLQARGLEIRRGRTILLQNGNLTLRRGEIVFLTGPNGAGKSTLARVLAGLEPPAEGSVDTTGRPALMLPLARLLFFHPTVAREVEATGASTGSVARVLRRHRLEALAARAPWSLSRGEQQRLVHAVLDLLRPPVMILDEPGQGLDPESLVELVHLVHRRAEHGRAYLVISHRRELARVAHRCLELRQGRLAEAP